MIRTYITIAIKYLIKQPSYSVLSILGFSLAFASVFFIYAHVSYQTGYDKHVDSWDRVYRLSGEINLPANENIHGLLGPRLAPALKDEIPAIENMTRLFPSHEQCIITKDETVFFEEQVYYADSTVFKVFPLKFLSGSPEEALVSDGQVVISESIALKYFGKTDVVGQSLKINNAKEFVITGVTRDLPENTHHKMHILISLNSFESQRLEQLNAPNSENYWRPSAYQFILLGEHNHIQEVEEAFPSFYEKYMAEFGNFLKADFSLIITPLQDLHFTPQFAYDLPKGNRSYNYLLIGAGVFLLLIALLNYINLLSASMAARTRSLGVFKINGASRSHVYKLLITESLIIIVTSTLIAWFILSGVESYFKNWMGGALLSSGFQTGSFLVVVLIIIGAFTIAFLLSVISKIYRQPIHLLRGNKTRGPGRRPNGFGKGSIILQFTFSVILIIASILITRQVQFLLKADVGYNTDNVVQVKIHAEGLPVEKIFSFKEEVKKSPLVSSAAYSSNVPGESLGTSHFKLNVDGQEASKIVHLMTIDADYIPLMEMEFRDGKNFNPKRPREAQAGVIMNEACIDFLGLGDSLAGTFIRNIEVLGVLNSGKYSSLHDNSRPIIFTFGTENRGYMNVKLNTSDMHAAMAYLEEIYEKFFDAIPFESTFMDQTVEEMYENDINQSKLLAIFTILSIVVANIGLFGLVALLNRKRIKEIGIRKVNGAQKWQIVLLLSKQLLLWVLIAVGIAIPITWYISKLWLQNFASQASFAWWIIPLGGMIILLSAMLTTALITLRASNRNPIETLRYE
jgi:putative ABC transport system permease protein